MARAMDTNSVNDFIALENYLKALSDKAPDAYEKELKSAAQLVADSARKNIKSKTGKLRSSIEIKRYTSKGNINYRVQAGGTRAPHAHLVEFGHRMVKPNGSGEVIGDVPAHPFLRKALDENRDSIVNALDAALDKIL
jgi:HK97 gp10 family phage protein